MRKILSKNIEVNVVKMILSAQYNLPEDVSFALEEAYQKEESVVSRSILDDILKNIDIAKEKQVALCQDTGFAVFFVEIGSGCYLEEPIECTINRAVAIAYKSGYLRKSILKDPLLGENSQDNTPAVVWINMTDGDKLKIAFAAKGGGSENMSSIAMLKPSDGEIGLINFVVDTVKKAGGNPCPPIILGIGIGGTFEKCAWLSKKALLRKIGSENPKKHLAHLEQKIYNQVNSLGVGPMGMGGYTTALSVFIEDYPRHIASFPVAINIQCHSSRHQEIIL